MTVRQAQAQGGRSAWRVLRYRDYRLYFAGSLASNIGTWLQNTAQVLLAYQLTHSVLAVGLVTCAQFSGSLLLGPWAAVAASRLGGKPVLVSIQLVSAAFAALMAMLEAAGRLGEATLILGALGLGLAFTFALPVQTALAPRLVPAADTEAAMAMNSVSYNAGRALAPALCVLVVHAGGFGWAFGLNAVSFLVFATVLPRTRPRSTGRPARPARARDGISIAMQVPRIALLLAMVAAVTLADDPILTLGPALARQLGISSGWAGLFFSALGCGTILGSFGPTKDPRAWHPSRTARWAAGPLLVLVASVAVFALGLSPWVSLAAALVAGAAAFRTGAIAQTQLVRERPANAASVMALWAIAWAGTKPLASLTDGWIASAHGILWAVAVVAGPAVLLGALEIFLPASWKGRIKDHLARPGDPRRQPAPPLAGPPLVKGAAGRAVSDPVAGGGRDGERVAWEGTSPLPGRASRSS